MGSEPAPGLAHTPGEAAHTALWWRRLEAPHSSGTSQESERTHPGDGQGPTKTLNGSSSPSLPSADIPDSLVAINVLRAQIPQDPLYSVQSPGLECWAIQKVFRKSCRVGMQYITRGYSYL